MSYRAEFPAFPVMPEAEQLLAAGWTDVSYHNDTCPSFVNPQQTVCIYVEHPQRDQREEFDAPRFVVGGG